MHENDDFLLILRKNAKLFGYYLFIYFYFVFIPFEPLINFYSQFPFVSFNIIFCSYSYTLCIISFFVVYVFLSSSVVMPQ